MKVGFLCSAGGSAAFTALDILQKAEFIDYSDVALVTDRACGAEDHARMRGITSQRIEIEDRNIFSMKSLDFFQENDCTSVLLYFSRLIAPKLYESIPCLNIHPSLLPAFPGFGALRRAFEAHVCFIGATLHEATGKTDGGPIRSQVNSPVNTSHTLDDFRRISFVQKVYLTLVAFELINKYDNATSAAEQQRSTPSASPALRTPKLIAGFEAFAHTRPEALLVP